MDDKADFGSREAGKKGGKARAERLSPDERAAIARSGAMARWKAKKEGDPNMPVALCGGDTPLRIGNVEIPCYVLDDERRVITLSGMQSALGMSASGGSPRLAHFAQAIADNPSMAKDLSSRLESPVQFVLPKGGTAYGYEATLLADLCDAILEARKNEKLTKRYEDIAQAAETLVRGFAIVGVTALVDEATGYEKVRRRMQLAEILDKYLSDKLNPWTKTFPDEFYIELFRLKGWDFASLRPGDGKPAEVGTITREVVYRRLHPGIVQELERQNPQIVPGRRLYKHHQWLSHEIGHPALREHLAKIITTMQLSPDWITFQRNLQRVLPLSGDTAYFDEFFKDDE